MNKCHWSSDGRKLAAGDSEALPDSVFVVIEGSFNGVYKGYYEGYYNGTVL